MVRESVFAGGVPEGRRFCKEQMGNSKIVAWECTARLGAPAVGKLFPAFGTGSGNRVSGRSRGKLAGEKRPPVPFSSFAAGASSQMPR